MTKLPIICLGKSMRTFFSNKLLILLSVSFCVLLTSCDMKEYPRKMLPSSATNIHEYNWQSSFPPDYCYFLKAKISEKEFIEYRNKMGFLKYRDAIEIDWSGFNDIGNWWNPSKTCDSVYYDPTKKGSGKAYIKYENGSLYYKESSGI